MIRRHTFSHDILIVPFITEYIRGMLSESRTTTPPTTTTIGSGTGCIIMKQLIHSALSQLNPFGLLGGGCWAPELRDENLQVRIPHSQFMYVSFLFDYRTQLATNIYICGFYEYDL